MRQHIIFIIEQEIKKHQSPSLTAERVLNIVERFGMAPTKGFERFYKRDENELPPIIQTRKNNEINPIHPQEK